MGLGNRIRFLFRMFLLFTVLVTVASISAVTVIRLSIRGRQENMPNLVGSAQAAAQRTTAALGLDLKVVDQLYSNQYAAGQVVSQMPPPGTRVKMGQRVHVLVSLGPPPLEVPNLVGTSARAARITITQRGLTIGQVIALRAADAEPGQVLAQEPPPSTADVHGPTVNLLVAASAPPPAYVCPSFIGQPLAVARRAVEQAGFKVGQVQNISTETATKGTVLGQLPQPGTKIGPEQVFEFQVAD